MKSNRAAVAALCLGVGIAAAQTSGGPSFEVASIKPAAPLDPVSIQSGKVRLGMKVDGAQVDFGGMPLQMLLMQAYSVKQYQISGPDWLMTERFDITAKLPDGATQEQVPAMLQALLVERFKLAAHRENREHPVYALVVAKGGAKLKEAATDADTPPPPPAEGGRGGFSIPGPGGPTVITQGGRGGGAMVSSPQFGTMRIAPGPDGMHMEASKISMAALADMLTSFTDRPVVDQTELKGNYQVALDLSFADLMNGARSRGLPMPGPGPMPGGGPIGVAGPGAGPGGAGPGAVAFDPSGSGSIFTALQKLGLKLEARKAPLETIVVDHLEKTPTEN
jgi:uncharacterized protein (TIGR03435 family)